MKIKKYLSLLLALCLCLGLFPSAALAVEDFVIDENGVLTEYKGSSDDVVIPDSVTSIGSAAFEACTGLTSITIPGSVTSIGKSAFNHCTGLTSVTISDGVISIDNWAFQECTGLTSITIPDSVTAIGDGAFGVCTGLTSAVIGNGVISIGEYAFQGCTNLTNVVIGNSVTSINEYAFWNCTGLTSVTIPGSVTSIDNCAFEGCTGLTSITIPDSVTSIGDSAFSRCTGLTSITIPDSVTAIGDNAFYGCTGLQTVSVPSALETVYVFPETTEITRRGYYFDVKDGVLKGYRGTGGDVVIPNGVTEIGFIAFEDRSDLTSITIPNSVTTIGSGAFEGCTGLTGITIPDSVTTIDFDAFKGCTGLTSITIPDSVTTLGDSAFEGCTGLTSVTIGDGLTDINWTCFRDCANIASLTLGNHVERVSFHLPLLVRELVIPDSVTEWPELQCPRLTKLTFPKNNWVFKGISRADFMEELKNYPALNEIVNCPNEYVDDLIAPNLAIKNNWTDPQSTIVPQSARITRLSNEITAGCTTDYDKAKAISEWVSTHIKYDDDYYYAGLKNYSDVPFDPEEILDKGQAVCAGYTRLTQALMVAQNIPCLYVLGWTKPGYHSWNLALIDGEYLWMDNTWHGINGRNYFGLGIYAISKDHKATSAAAFNGVKGPGTLVNGVDADTETTKTTESTGIGTTLPETAEETQARETIEALRSRYPEGMSWTNGDSYYSEGLNSTGSGCAGFAYICSDAVFGKAPAAESHSSFDRIKVGDILRINNGTHSVVVLRKMSDGVVVTEGNYNGTIHWDREITRADLEKEGLTVTTRWGTKAEEKAAVNSVLPSDAGTAYASTQTVEVDGRRVEFQCYALKDANGNDTNYIKLRDLADILNGTNAQFQVGWDGNVTITTSQSYTRNGSEQNTPFSGPRSYVRATAPTYINGTLASLSAFVLNDDRGGGYTYYQLRDLGQAIGFNVGWSAERGIYLETDKPYDANN